MISEQLERPIELPSEAQASAQEIIRVDGLTKTFATGSGGRAWWRARRERGGVVAVDDVSFQVERGQTFVIMGLSGSGKSTIIRMLNRLVEPTAGSIVVDGRQVESLGSDELRGYRNQTINMVFQHFALFPHKTLIDNVAFGLKVRGASRQNREALAVDALRRVGLGERINALPEQLSGGMRQRVGLARALATDAEILLMDEPFSALDPLIRKDMQNLLLELQTEFRKTIVFVTHDLNEAMRLGDRIMVMKTGRCVQQGTSLDLLRAPADPYIEEFVGEVDRGRVLTAKMIAAPADESTPHPAHDGAAAVQSPQVTGETTVNDLLPLFERGADRVLVMEEGRLIGVVTPHDLFSSLAGGERS